MFAHLLILILLVVPGQTQWDQPCEKGCECSRGKATCVNLKSFPIKLPRNLRYLDVTNMNCSVIPPGALAELPHLQEVKILNSKINSIRPCAFNNLRRVQIRIENSDIHQIESGAFSHLTKGASISLKGSRIVRIYSFAFNNLHNITNLEIYKCTFQTIGPFSFNNISFVDKIELSYNTLPVLPALTFQNVTNIQLYQMEFNKFFGFSCNPFGRLFWHVNLTIQVLNQFPCTCEVARFLRSSTALPSKVRQMFSVENMCYTPREKFLTKLVEEQGDCHSLVESGCVETSGSKLELICYKRSFKRTDQSSSVIPQATINPTMPSTRDPNRLYTDEAEPFDPTTHKKGHVADPKLHSISSGGSHKYREAADGTLKEGSASSGDRDGSSRNEGSAGGSGNHPAAKTNYDQPKHKGDGGVAPSTSSDPMSHYPKRPFSNGYDHSKPKPSTEAPSLDPHNKPKTFSGASPQTTPRSYLKPGNANIDSNSGVGAVRHAPATQGPHDSKSTKSTSLEYRNRPNRSGAGALVAYKLSVLSFLFLINFVIHDL